MKATINDYLSELAKYLNVLPKKDRDNIVAEIELHLNEKVNEIKEEGYSDNEAINKVLTDFKTPKSLSLEMMEEYDDKEIQNKPTFFVFFSAFCFAGFAQLAIPILRRELDAAFISLGLILIICGIITIPMKKNWRIIEIKTIKFFPKICLSLYFPVSLLFFWLKADQQNNLTLTWIYYLVAYWIVLLLYALLSKKISQKAEKAFYEF
ncbi:HAAS signaling domain-containing protein [Oceanobacillus neutriphilus]|uniref:DUF1700 domain-containing protein n=1 Tax=Oceanobacillus neutriphilus TaxID=531815 RepID=A0ABQ2P2D8_9BACI|nr:permease prefix domain 1-containing protein [Oceanobacillus neutriphilus]GGP16565.1 hypothetical protein GCM10011346_49040 [Oceanobacillus neutriphilus]